MIYQILFYGSLAAIGIGCLIAFWMVGRRPLKPFARNLLLTLIVFEIVTAGLHLFSIADQLPLFWDWFLDLQYEFNLGSIFSALQLMVIALVALLNGWLTPGLKGWQRLYWLLLVGVFVFLSLDEFYSFHETLGGRVPTEAWRIPYAIVGGFVFLASVAAFWFGFRRQIRLFVLLFMGLMIMAVAGIGVEEFVMQGFVYQNNQSEWMYVFEEIFEMVGATIILAGFVSAMQENLPDRVWDFARRFLVLGGTLYTVWLLFSWLLLPALEARFVATPVSVRYEGGLEMVGVDVQPKNARPGDEIALTLYWRANEPLRENYSLSVHALSHPQIGSVAQSDDLHLGTIPSGAWFPHVTMRRTVYLRLPETVPTPASYWLMVRAWFGPWPLGRPWEDTTGVPVTSAEGVQPFAADAVVVAEIPVVSNEAPSTPPVSADARFADGFTLMGYELPAQVNSHALLVSFWWRADSDIHQELTQFFHLVPRDGGDVIAFDQPPFGGTFPTRDWPGGAQFVDSWQVTLPPDLPAGTYDVLTGMYDSTTIERIAVTQGGQPLPDNAVRLGTIDFAPSADAESTPVAAMPLSAEDYCYAIADSDLAQTTTIDHLAAINRITGEVIEIGPTGTENVEALTFSADGTTLWSVDERRVGLFGSFDRLTGAFTPIGSGIASLQNPALGPAVGNDDMRDTDGIAVDPVTGMLWAIIQDGKNYLYTIDPDTGTVVRSHFADQVDFVRIDLTGLPGPTVYSDVEDLAIDPRDGTFYIIAANDDYAALLARLDFDTLDTQAGTIAAVAVTPFVSEDGTEILDMEALSFFHDDTLYAVSTNNSTNETYYDVLWRVDPATGRSTRIGQFSAGLEYVDYEGLACLSSPPENE